LSSSKLSLHHLPFLAITLVLCLAAVWGGLARMGWALPWAGSALHVEHGPLMVSGFFGTLISLERAAALRKSWTYLGPAMTALGGTLTAAGVLQGLGAGLLVVGSAWLVVMFIPIIQRQPATYTVVMGAGAVCLLVGNLLWTAGWPVFKFVLWWVAFLVLTIAGERLELGRVQKQTPFSSGSFTTITGVYFLGLVVLLLYFDLGTRIVSAATAALAAWLWKYDIARRTAKKEGVTRFIALALLGGYLWLGGSGLIGVWQGGISAGPYYDALLHSALIGFVFAMIFGHAPIIFPALLNIPVKYSPVFYAPLILLHLSLLLRIGGDFSGVLWARQWGGMVNAAAILIYFLLLSPLTDRWLNKQ